MDRCIRNQALREVKNIIDSNKQTSTDDLIWRLNSKILGWARYYRYSGTHKTFSNVDYIIWKWIWNWCHRHHPRKSKNWNSARYNPRESDLAD
ncbi:MAG: group II intron maturase-specific domain-containing protein [Promethearchaeota archaeon]